MAGLNPSGTLNIGSTNTRYTSIGKNHAIVADHETDTPAGHVVTLGHREKLDRNVARARHLKN